MLFLRNLGFCKKISCMKINHHLRNDERKVATKILIKDSSRK